MIASIRGILRQKGSESAVVEAGGLGYELHLTQPALLNLPPPGETVEFFTYFHVREDSQQLYGFATPEEKQLFLLLLTVKGVGPKLGMAVLSNLGSGPLVAALRKRDLARLGSVPGVGKKLAERLGVELSDKAMKLGAELGSENTAVQPGMDLDKAEQAAKALVALGYSFQQARQSVAKAHQSLGSGDNKVEDIVKAALKFF